MPFTPSVPDTIDLPTATYRIARHPLAPGRPLTWEGQTAVVYRLLGPSAPVALKVFAPAYRFPTLVSRAQQLASLASLPGLRAAQRTVLTPREYSALVQQHPDLRYALLMPWIAGSTWQDVVRKRDPLTPLQALRYARALATTLTALEEHGAAHGDLSGANVLLADLTTDGEHAIELVDLEGMVLSCDVRPFQRLHGSPGYAHSTVVGGAWGPDLDRFAGAILLAEMLGWCDGRVCAAAWGESYFAPEEMQSPAERAAVLTEVLQNRWGITVSELWQQAWRAPTLADCPSLSRWLIALPDTAANAEREPPAQLWIGLPKHPAAAERRPSMPSSGTPEAALVETVSVGSSPITAANATHVVQRACLGRGVPNEVAYSPDGQLLAVATSIGLTLYSVATWAFVRQMMDDQWTSSLAFAPDGRVLASAGHAVRLWRVSDGQLLRTLPGTSQVNSVAFAPDGSVLASASDDGNVRLRRVSDGQLLHTWYEGWRVGSVAFAPDGRVLASASNNGEVRLRRVSDGQLLRTLQVPGGTWSVAFDPDGRVLASTSNNGPVQLWRVSDGQLLHTLHGHTSGVGSVAFAPDGRVLASASADRTVRLWRVSDGQLLHTLHGHTYWVESVAFAPDGSVLASASAKGDDTVRLWRVSDGQPLHTLHEHTSSIWSVAFTPDGSVLASASNNGPVRLWRVNDGQLLHTLRGHAEMVASVAFAPDGSVLASASKDRTVRLWNVPTGALLRTLEGHTHWVRSVAFAPDGRLLASGSVDGTVRLWGVPRPGSSLHDTYLFDNEDTHDYNVRHNMVKKISNPKNRL